MRIQLDEGAIMPSRAHKADAGLDLMARECQTVPAHGSAIFRTGVHVETPEGCAGLLVSKSGLNVRHDITSTGLIDSGYTGEIVVKLDNSGEDRLPREARRQGEPAGDRAAVVRSHHRSRGQAARGHRAW